MIITIILIVMAAIITVILGFALYIWWIKKQDDKKDEWDILNYMEKHPDRSAFYLIHNHTVLARHSENQIMPLASTVKIIIAIEYAKQASQGVLDKDKWILLTELEVYYIEGTDGGAHKAWLEHLKRQDPSPIQRDKVQLHEVAKGMIHFSSNANTEYLLDLLGTEEVNHHLSMLGLDRHEEIYFFLPSFLIPAYLKVEESLSLKYVIQKMKRMSMEDYKAYSKTMHDLLKQRKADHLIEKITKGKVNHFDIERIISNRLPGATAREYAILMNQIHHGDHFDEGILVLLKDLLERSQNKYFRHIGIKGGSTLFIDANALYVTDHEQNDSALGLFINDSKGGEMMWIRREVDPFILRTLTDKTFQDEVASRLASLNNRV